MNLKDYLAAERGRYRSLAKDAQLDEAYVWQVANGKRNPKADLCVRIEKATKGEVRRWDLRPNDWWLIWPELIGMPGAPALTALPKEAA